MRSIVFFLMVVLLPSNSFAITGNEMLNHCKSEISENQTNSYGSGFCTGAVSTLGAVGSFLNPEMRFCTPPGVSRVQLVRVVVQHMERYPHLLHTDFIGISSAALRIAWPCKL